MTNRELRALRGALRTLWDCLPREGNGVPEAITQPFDSMITEIEDFSGTELLLNDLHPNLDPPDDDDPVAPFDIRLRVMLNNDGYVVRDWPDMTEGQKEAYQSRLTGEVRDDEGYLADPDTGRRW